MISRSEWLRLKSNAINVLNKAAFLVRVKSPVDSMFQFLFLQLSSSVKIIWYTSQNIKSFQQGLVIDKHYIPHLNLLVRWSPLLKIPLLQSLCPETLLSHFLTVFVL